MESTSSPLVSNLEALRSIRVGEIALFDAVLSVAPFMFAARWYGLPMYRGAAAVLPVGIIAHSVFMVDTPLTNKFFDMDDHFALKLATVALAYIALEGLQ